MTIGGRWRERGETLGPALLAALALLLNLAEGGEAFVHAVALGLVALAAALSGAGAVMSLGRFGTSRLARRFAAWRAGGLGAGAACLALAVLERYSAPGIAADGTLQLTALGGLWALLTGWVWGRWSWERMSPAMRAPPSGTAGTSESSARVPWARQETGEA